MITTGRRPFTLANGERDRPRGLGFSNDLPVYVADDPLCLPWVSEYWPGVA